MTWTKTMRIAALATVVAALSAARAGAADDTEKLRAEVRDKVRAFRAERLIDALGLDEKTAAKLFPVLNKFDEQMMPLIADNGRARRELRQMIESGKVDDARANAIIDRIAANRLKLAKLDDERTREVRKVLSPLQAAKLVVVLPQIDRQIEKRIRQALRKRAGGGKPGGRGAGDEDDD